MFPKKNQKPQRFAITHCVADIQCRVSLKIKKKKGVGGHFHEEFGTRSEM